MLRIIFFVFCCVEPAVFHYLLFPDNGFFEITTPLIILLGFLFFGLLTMCGRKVLFGAILFETVIFLLLAGWHTYSKDALSVSIVLAQYKEGLRFLAGNTALLLNRVVFFVLMGAAVKMIYVFKFFHSFPFRWDRLLICVVPLCTLLVSGWAFFYENYFNYMRFKAYAKTFGYVPAWLYEGVTAFDRGRLFDKLIENARRPQPSLPDFLKDVRLSDNVFVIQLESVDYEGLMAEVNGRPVMPFLRAAADKGILFKVYPRTHSSTANADFTVLSGINNIDELYASVYNMLPAEYWRYFYTLPQKASALGYRTAFYHGFYELYYDRLPNVQQMGFDEIWFQKDMPSWLREGDVMGDLDGDVFRFVLQRNREVGADKNFNFIITITSHWPFSNGFSEPYSRPQNIKEDYLNSVNYVDKALKGLITGAPDNSLFLMYSDHFSVVSDRRETFFLIYQKGKNFAVRPREINFASIVDIIHGLFKTPTSNKQNETQAPQ